MTLKEKKIIMKTASLMTAIFLGASLVCFHPGRADALPDDEIPVMKIQVKLDLAHQLLSGTALVRRQAIENFELNVSGIRVTGVTEVENNRENLPFYIKKGRLFLEGPVSKPSDPVSIRFMKSLKKDSTAEGKEFLGGNFADSRFALLLSGWCPLFSVPAIYEIEAKVNTGIVAVSEADEVTRISGDGFDTFKFSFPHPRNSASLVAGRFHVTERQQGEVTLSTFFLNDDRELAGRFLEKAGYFIDLFSRKISPYPFKRFCIVENPAPSGLALPTFTLIGRQILRMPFILDISLGHEILHSWFGNSIYVDYHGGNWSEGITTYLADHYFKSIKGRGAGYRHQILCDYKSYVNGKNSISLDEFRTRTDRASKAVGYGKAAMVFHMLRRLTGDDQFFSAISEFSLKYRFKTASWKDIEGLFSKCVHKDLSGFFSQWLERSDIPVLRCKEASAEQDEEGVFRLQLKIEQENRPPYSLQVPLTIFTENGPVKRLISLSKSQETFSISLKKRPIMAILDRDYHVMRDLSPREFPPSLSRLFGAEKKFIIAPEDKEKPTYQPIISFFQEKGFEIVQRDKLRHSMFKTGSFVVLGGASGRLAQLGPELGFQGKGMAIGVRNNPFNPGQVTCALLSSSAEDCRKVMFKLPHYGNYSYLRFENGKLMEKRKAHYERGISIRIRKGISGIKSSAVMNAPAIIDSLSGAGVIYLGERHDQQGIHEAQLKIIEALSGKGPVAVAMEMFQRPFQKVIDAYLKGRLPEREFLKKTEYFKRWGFNYHFYRPIVEYCKTHHIPVLAMNLPAEISRKIARSGLQSLSPEERRALPHKLDFSNELYRQMLLKIYEGHEADAIQNFDSFFQAQIAWDETMARSISDFLDAHPERKIIVIVGGGHVAFGYGIPSRVAAREKAVRQAIVLFPEAGQIDPLEADYFLFVPEKKEPFVARLGVMLSGNNTLTVENVVPGSPAALGGLKKGDVIEAMDGQKIGDIYDLKLELFFKKKGQTASITILRTGKDGAAATKVLETGPLVPFDWTGKRFHFHRKR